ncbi:MAG: hypothetical protein H6713_20515 [Myxococcales bacterium]|nr:hypothetical protein [Myxococcales bacterium]
MQRLAPIPASALLVALVCSLTACGDAGGTTAASETDGAGETDDASTGAPATTSGPTSDGATGATTGSSDATTTSGAATDSDATTATTEGPALADRLLMIDNGLNRLILLDPGGGPVWITDIPSGARDLQLLPDDRALVSHGGGALEVSLSDGAIGWMIDDHQDIQTARRLDDGVTTLLGANAGPGVVFSYVDGDGAVQDTLEISGVTELRLARVLEGGNILFTAGLPWMAMEVNPAGETVWKAILPGKGYLAERLPNGNTLATTGDAVTVLELDEGGEVVNTLGGKQSFPDIGLDWFSGFTTLSSGDVVAANWLGHDKWGTGPHLVQFTPDNALAWSWEDHELAMQVTNVLAVPAD